MVRALLGRREQVALLVLAAVVIFGLGYKYAVLRVPDKIPLVQKDAAAGEEEAGEVVVHVAGAVSKPGLYRLPRGARIDDALREAQPLAEADLDALNLAALLEDQQKVFVPLKAAAQGAGPLPAGGTAPPGTAANPFASPQPGGRININTADAATLDQLPGIGPSLAARIIQYRQENGPFASVEDLVNVPGIGEKKLADLRDRVTVH
ncbi:MAG: ComEA family DNA-binding protein [Bacillota bacterium]|nr:ComEA family DNA-binding protein [Bacillota bacterium]